MWSVHAYVQESTIITLQIPNLIDEDMLFHFMDGLQNWSMMGLQRRQVSTIVEAIMQAEVFPDFNYEKANQSRGEEKRVSHNHGGGDCVKIEE